MRLRSVRTGVKEFLLIQDTYLAVYFDLLVPVLADVPDEIVHLSHQLQVAEGQFV